MTRPPDPIQAVEDEDRIILPPPDETEIIDDDDELEEDEKPPREPEVREAMHRKKKKTPVRARGRSKASLEKQKQTREMTVEEWIAWCDAKWGWDRPGVNCSLDREYPRQINGIPSAGRVATRSGGTFSVDEIQELYGGGEYQMMITVPAAEYGKAPVISRKKFAISGAPKLSALQVDAAQAEAISGGNAAPGLAGMAPNKDFYGMLDKQIERTEKLWRDRIKDGGGNGRFNPQDIRAPYEHSMKAITEVSERAAQERIRAAEQLAQDKEVKAREAKEEAERMKREMREFEQEQRAKVQEAVSRSSDLLGALLPTFSENAARQVDQITRTFEAREARIEESHARATHQQNQLHQAQLQQQAQLHQAEVARIEATAVAQRGLLEQHLQAAQMEVVQLRDEARRLRDELMALRIGQFEAMQKERDPMTKLGELAQLREAIGDMGFHGGGGEDDGLGGDAPQWMRLFDRTVQSVAPVVQAAFGKQQEERQQMQQQQQLQQLAVMRQQRAAATAGQLPAAQDGQQPQAPAAAPKRTAKVKKADVQALMATIQTAYLAKTPAERVVEIAAKHPEVDTDLLRVLTRKNPDKVLAELDGAGLIPDPLRSTEGSEYLKAMLVALPNHI